MAKHSVMKRSLFSVVLALAVLVPSSAFATEVWSGWWRHSATPDACLRGASAAFTTAQLTAVYINNQTSMVSGRTPEYTAIATCIDNVAVLTVTGPNEQVAQSLYQRIQGTWQ
jgi:hypothetical protein